MAFQHPGVFIQEISSGIQPIEGVSTSTACFIGKAEMGPLNQPTLVTSLSEFQATFGGYLNDSYLAQSVFQFFNNGGKKTYIVRISGSGATAAAISLKDRKTTPSQTLTVQAANAGVWGNKLDLVVTDGTNNPANEFNLQVFRDRSDLSPPLPSLLLERFENLSMNPAAANFVDRVVAAGSAYISTTATAANAGTAVAGMSRGGVLPVGNGADVLLLGTASGGTEAAGTAGPPATAGTSRSGDSPSINPAADKRKIVINLDGDGPREIAIAPTAATGADIAASIQASVRALRANTASKQSAYDGFTCKFQTPASPGKPFYLLTSGSTGTTSSVVVTNSSATGIQLPSGTFRIVITINGDGPHEVVLTGPLNDGAAIASAIQAAVTAIKPKRAANQAAFTGFTCSYDTTPGAGSPALLLTSGFASAGSSVVVSNATNQNVATLLKLGLTNGGSEVNGSAVLRPANSAVPDTEYQLGDAFVSGNVFSVVLGADGNTPGDSDYMNGLPALDPIRDVNLVAIPGIGSLAVVSQGATTVLSEATASSLVT